MKNAVAAFACTLLLTISTLAQATVRGTIGGLPKDNWVWEQTRLNSGYEPAPTFRRMKCPVLIIYGEKDNPSQGIARLKQYLNEAGNKDYTVRVFQGADHDLEVGDPKDGKITWAEGFLELLPKWTLDRVTVPLRR